VLPAQHGCPKAPQWQISPEHFAPEPHTFPAQQIWSSTPQAEQEPPLQTRPEFLQVLLEQQGCLLPPQNWQRLLPVQVMPEPQVFPEQQTLPRLPQELEHWPLEQSFPNEQLWLLQHCCPAPPHGVVSVTTGLSRDLQLATTAAPPLGSCVHQHSCFPSSNVTSGSPAPVAITFTLS
jgi:hypothetical protein